MRSSALGFREIEHEEIRQAMSVLSRYIDADALNRLAGRGLEPQGLVLGNLAGGHRSPLAGFAVEFAGHRPYVAGDDPRHIDWRLYYTRDKLFIKQYEMETNFVCHMVLDVSASMSYGAGETNKLAYASRLVGTLGYSIIKQNDKVALATIDDLLRESIAPGNSFAQVHRMVELLEGIEPIRPTGLADGLLEFAARTGRRAIVMVFSDFFSDLAQLEAALQQLRFRNHEVVLFQVLHPDEWEFPLRGLTRFVGLEQESNTEQMQAEDVRTGYMDALRQHVAELDALCHRNRIELVAVNTGQPAAESLANYLDERVRISRR